MYSHCKELTLATILWLQWISNMALYINESYFSELVAKDILLHDNSIFENMISHNVWSLFKYVYQFTCCGYLFSFSIYVPFMLKWCQHIQLEFEGTTWKWGH
jgi:hypothetical protein